MNYKFSVYGKFIYDNDNLLIFSVANAKPVPVYIEHLFEFLEIKDKENNQIIKGTMLKDYVRVSTNCLCQSFVERSARKAHQHLLDSFRDMLLNEKKHQ